MKKKWSAEEDLFLKENWQNVDTVKIADFLNRSILGVQRRAQRLQLPDGRVKWTLDQVHLLRSSWGHELKSPNDVVEKIKEFNQK